jgi:putative spermidine/putrescine transport system permease protein
MVSVVVRSYGWTILLSNRGVLNAVLALLHLPPLRLMFEVSGVVIGLVHVLSPFVVLSVMAAALHQDPALREAAATLGARPLRSFLQVTLPLVAPALLTGTALVFLLACGAVVTPLLLGGVRARMIGQQIYQDIFELFDLVKAAALSVVLLGLTLAVAILLAGGRRLATRR